MTTVARFELSYHQVLNEHGQLVGPLPDFAQHAETIKKLYADMVRSRIFDKKAIALQRTGKMGTYAPINGQEALSTAVGYALQPTDVFVPYYRDYPAQFQRGVKMSEILAYWGGDERGSAFEHNKEDLPICVPIASQCLHAAGVAFAFQYRNQDRVALCCIGDGGTSEGDFYEAMNVAGAWNLPLVFVVNNNQWAISVPLSAQTAAQTIAQKAIAAGIHGVQVDGNDLIACCDLISQAVEKARRGEGATVIEALTYRLCDHTTADDATRYQPPAEVAEAKTKEPIGRLKTYLQNLNLWDDTQEKALVEEASQQVQAAVDEYLNRPAQPVSSIFDYQYATLPDYLIEQRQLAIEEADREA